MDFKKFLLRFIAIILIIQASMIGLVGFVFFLEYLMGILFWFGGWWNYSSKMLLIFVVWAIGFLILGGLLSLPFVFFNSLWNCEKKGKLAFGGFTLFLILFLSLVNFPLSFDFGELFLFWVKSFRNFDLVVLILFVVDLILDKSAK